MLPDNPHRHSHARDGRTITRGDKALQAVSFQNIGVEYGPVTALDGVTFSVEDGSLCGVIGPNGAGKSTLIKTVVGLVKPARGQVLVHGRTGHRMRSAIGFVPQLEQVDWNFPASVWDVAMMGLTPQRGLFRQHNRANRDAAATALNTVNMLGFRNRGIGELSGGQRRRVLLARAIVSDPLVLLLDEPMTGLDTNAQEGFLDIIDGLREHGTTVIMCTHNLTSVSERASDVAVINGRLMAYGPPDEIMVESVLADAFDHQLMMGSSILHRKHQLAWPGRS